MKNRFEEKFLVALDGCWLWTASVDKDGYRKFGVGRSNWKLAHRISYTIYNGEIKAGMVIDHLCRQRSCVNPHHLEQVSIAENNKRKDAVKL